MATVALCVPHTNFVAPDFYRHLLLMQGVPTPHQFVHVEIDMAIVGKARNDLVTLALQHKADVLWFIDDDVMIPQHAGKLVDLALEHGVVGGLYFNRRPPHLPQLYKKAEEPQYNKNAKINYYWPMLEYTDGLMKVDAIGAGCLAIRADVFIKLQEHAAKKEESLKARVEASTDPLVHELYKQTPHMSPWFEFTDVKGEDLYFCEKCAEIGQAVWVDTSVKCVHLGYLGIWEEHFQFLKRNNMIQKLELPE